MAASPEQAETLEAPGRASATTLDVQATFAAAVRDELVQGGGYEVQASGAADHPSGAAAQPSGLGEATIVTDVTRVGFQRELGRHVEVRLETEAKMMVTYPTGKTESRQANCMSAPHLPSDWAADGSRRLAEELRSCFAEMARSLVMRSFNGAGFLVAGKRNCMLEIEPVARRQSSNVTIRWEAFPRDVDLGAAYADRIRRVSNVRYDLAVWLTAYPYIEGSFVQRIDGLTSTAYTLELPPSPAGQHYAVSVRARFDLDGHPRATSWSRMDGCPGEYDFIDEPYILEGFERFIVRAQEPQG